MKLIIGIDLGTTYSTVAQFDEHGRSVVMNDSNGESLVPSCVAFFKKKWWVGDEARRQWASGPSNAAARFKRHMGTSERFPIGKESCTPTQLSAHVLGYLSKMIENHEGEIGSTVVTIPANFSVEARQATLDAAKQAKLNVDYIINEPTAAALYYAYSGDLPGDGNYAVYDLGGGTFDISLIEVEGGDVDVIASNGVSRLGGMDFDHCLQQIVRDKFKEATGESLEDHEMHEPPLDLVSIEELKRRLTRRETVTVFARGTLIEISRKEFEEAISRLVLQAEICCESTLEEAGMKPSDLTGVILAGGSTRVPLVQESILKVFDNIKLVQSTNVDEVVALGAALYAALRSDSSEYNAVQNAALACLSLQEVTNMNFGTVALGSHEVTGYPMEYNSIIIEKGTPIPCSEEESYFTVRHGQDKIDCRITECSYQETELNDFVRIISKDTILELPPPPEGGVWPSGEEIIITYSYDENQIMHCSFKHHNTGETKEVSLNFT